jgi:phage I-like protein
MPSRHLIAACAVSIPEGKRVQLFPQGEVLTHTGRRFIMTADIGRALVAQASARKTPFSIDYDHASLFAMNTGARAPAAGWFKTLEWVDGDGLYATDVEWTAAASEMIRNREYLYISPAFRHDKSGAIQALINAGLTNTPDIDGMDAVAASALTLESQMDEELLERLRYMFNLPTLSSPVEIRAELEKLLAMLPAGSETAATSVLARLESALSARDTQISALSATQFDPARFVPMDQYAAAQGQVAALSQQIESGERQGLLTAGLADGRILPGAEGYWQAQPMAALKGFLAVAQPISALSATQTGGKPPVVPAAGAGLDASALAVCSQMGIAPETFAAQRAALGLAH